jgi:CheY-like chemotaxis protein
VTVASEPGQGTAVRAYFPRAELPETPPETAAGPAPAAACILVVEDNDAVREVAREALEMEGYRVIEASDGPQALELCQRWEGPLDLVVTDVVMPHMSGGELVRQLAARRRDLRVLLISGYTDDAVVRHGIEAGMPFLQKPFSLEALARKVRAVLEAPPSRSEDARGTHR